MKLYKVSFTTRYDETRDELVYADNSIQACLYLEIEAKKSGNGRSSFYAEELKVPSASTRPTDTQRLDFLITKGIIRMPYCGAGKDSVRAAIDLNIERSKGKSK